VQSLRIATTRGRTRSRDHQDPKPKGASSGGGIAEACHVMCGDVAALPSMPQTRHITKHHTGLVFHLHLNFEHTDCVACSFTSLRNLFHLDCHVFQTCMQRHSFLSRACIRPPHSLTPRLLPLTVSIHYPPPAVDLAPSDGPPDGHPPCRFAAATMPRTRCATHATRTTKLTHSRTRARASIL